MAKPSLAVIQALRNTAQKLEVDRHYQWGHMGACNCGYLAQEVTKLSKEVIHLHAMEGHGDWSEQLNDYCPNSGLGMDQLISELTAFGFERDDLKHLERLSDPQVSLTLSNRYLYFNVKSDVITYLKAWANLLEDELIEDLTIPFIGKDLTTSSPELVRY